MAVAGGGAAGAVACILAAAGTLRAAGAPAAGGPPARRAPPAVGAGAPLAIGAGRAGTRAAAAAACPAAAAAVLAPLKRGMTMCCPGTRAGELMLFACMIAPDGTPYLRDKVSTVSPGATTTAVPPSQF